VIKIAFLSSWGDNSETLLDKYRVQTPNGNGIWDNLIGVSDLKNADFYVVMGSESVSKILDLIEKNRLDTNKIILFQREHLVSEKREYSIPVFKHFTYDNSYTMAVWWIDKPFDCLCDLPFNEKKNSASIIMSSKNFCKGHDDRLKFLKRFDLKYPGLIHIYGRGLGSYDLSSSYKGEIEGKCKFNGLYKYDYSLACENTCMKNYMSEKLYDCFLSWCLPVYYGCQNLDDYFPEESFIYLDINKSESVDIMYEKIQQKTNEKTISLIKEARNLVLYKYNIWPSVKRVIETGKMI